MNPVPRLFLILLCAVTCLCAQSSADTPNRPDPARRGRPQAVENYFHQLKKENPEEMRRLRELRRDDPDAFRAEMRSRMKGRRKGEHERREPKNVLFEEHVQRVRQASTPEEREEAVSRLEDAVTARMDAVFAHREEAIQRMRKKLSDLEERHRRQEENREAVVQRQVQKLLEAAGQEAGPDGSE
jgi:hypothetical protein